MSAIGPKRTSLIALHMSAFGGKADMTVCGNPLSRSLLGAKRTCPFALHMSANDPKRTYRRHVHGVDADGRVVFRRQLKRRNVLAFFQKVPSCLVGTEACATS